jgi:hypothetical protein
MSSPEVLDAAAGSERVASGQHPEIRDEEEAEEEVRLTTDETHLAFSQAYAFNLSVRAGPSPSENA